MFDDVEIAKLEAPCRQCTEGGIHSIHCSCPSMLTASNMTMWPPTQDQCGFSGESDNSVQKNRSIGIYEDARSVELCLQRFESVLVSSVAKLDAAVAVLSDGTWVPNKRVDTATHVEDNASWRRTRTLFPPNEVSPARSTNRRVGSTSTCTMQCTESNNTVGQMTSSTSTKDVRRARRTTGSLLGKHNIPLKVSSFGNDLLSVTRVSPTWNKIPVNRDFVSWLVYDNLLFRAFIVSALLTSTVTFGMQVNLTVQSMTNPVLDNVETTCTIIFTLELLLKLFLHGKDLWNCVDADLVLDAIIVSFAWVDLVVVICAGGGEHMQPELTTILTVVSSARSLRLARVALFVPHIRIVMSTIASSLDSLFWLCMLMLCVMYVFALILTAGMGQLMMRQHDISDDSIEDLKRSFGSVSRTTYTLFLAANGGVSWGEPASLVMEIGPSYFVVYLVFISLMIFSVLNVVLGVFVDGAIQLMERDRDLCAARAVSDHNQLLRDSRLLMFCLDLDENGIITWEEFRTALMDKKSRITLEVMGMDTSDLWELFTLIDTDEDGVITTHELLLAAHRSRGKATKLHMDVVMKCFEACKSTQRAVAEVKQELKNRSKRAS
eukprot:TRINITY_DN4750_c0_g1_i3.p1 TRINITY_DN4750_c0_g1~~TRINITY_DN4750_c0_g1_i3.p1  ORF type:complete len:648 (-),score=71.88 TRINITY_DN4750_c0_g1_i3:148-1965(-)